MENISRHQVIIIGAGPSGLLLGLCLQKGGVDYLIVEQNDSAGSTWDKMPEHLSLISLWHSNSLTKEDLNLSPKFKAHKAGEFAHYLRDFAKKNGLKIRFNMKFTSLEKVGDEFEIQTADGMIKSLFVVDCRGYFNFPFTPEFKVSGNPPLMLHFKDYKNTEQLKNYKKILIVGKRLSAGQLLKELSATKRHELLISARSKISYSSRPEIYDFF